MILDIELEQWDGSPVVREVKRGYIRKAAIEYQDEAAGLTARQAVFYRNLIRIAEVAQSPNIPVDFELSDGRRYFLDRGCVKIAEHAGFIEPIENDATGTVSSIRIAWTVR